MSQPNKDGAVLGIEDQLRFQCGKGVPCFNECCRDVTIFLGPYDVLRLRQAAGLTSREFLDAYTRIVATNRLIPLVTLRMNPENELRCFFVTPEGCSVYSHRPWACRMFPLDVTEDGQGFRVIIDDQRCQGLRELSERRVVEYLNDQGSPKYQVMDDLMGELVNEPRFRELDIENDQIQRMAFMALYDLDNFRKFIFESTFLDRFEVDPRRVKRLQYDDEELLRFGFEWVAFGLLGKRTLTVRANEQNASSENAGEDSVTAVEKGA